jgi:tRNA 2-thiouridine synthesizing protein A
MAELERDTEPQESIDAIGLKCPEPVMLLHAAMRRLAPGQELTLRATDPSTERDVPNFCEFLGHALLIARREGDEFLYRIRKVES